MKYFLFLFTFALTSQAVGQHNTRSDSLDSLSITSNNFRSVNYQETNYLPNVVIVQFEHQVSHHKLQTGLAEFDAKITQYEAYSIERVYPFLDHVEPTTKTQDNLSALQQTYYVRYHAHDVPTTVANDLSSTSGVIYAEPVMIYYIDDRKPEDVPNDPEITNQPELNQLRLPEAWDVVKGSEGTPKVIIAHICL